MAPPSTQAMTESRGTSVALSEQEILERTRDLAALLSVTVAPGGYSGLRFEAERASLRGSGLLGLSVPVAFGGIGARWPTTCRAIRILAVEGCVLAQAFALHHLQLAAIQLCGSVPQQRKLLAATVDERWIWGETANSSAHQVATSIHPNGFILDGTVSLSSNCGGADWLVVSAWDAGTQTTVTGTLATTEAGLRLQLDGGTVNLSSVLLEHDHVLQRPGQALTAQATLRTLVSQLAVTNLDLGLAQRAFHAAICRVCIEHGLQAGARPVPASGEHRRQEPYGKLSLLLHSAEVLADRAAAELERLFRKGVLVTAQERGDLALAVTEAECLTQRAVREVGRQVAELGVDHHDDARAEFVKKSLIKTSHRSTPAN